MFHSFFSDLFATTEDILYANIGKKHCSVSNKLLKQLKDIYICVYIFQESINKGQSELKKAESSY